MVTEDEKQNGLAIQKKLSSKTIMDGVKISRKLLDDNSKKELDLYQIVGNATDTKTGESNFGPWIALLGEFESVNLLTGEKMRSAKALLPNVVLEMVQAKMAGAGSDSRGVLFAFIVGIRVDDAENSSQGYTYYARSLVAPAVDDPMTKLLTTIPTPKIKPLPAPAEKTEKAAKK